MLTPQRVEAPRGTMCSSATNLAGILSRALGVSKGAKSFRQAPALYEEAHVKGASCGIA